MNELELKEYVKNLIRINNQKQKEFQIKYQTSPEVGFFTKETLMIAAKIPELQSLGIRLGDLNEEVRSDN